MIALINYGISVLIGHLFIYLLYISTFRQFTFFRANRFFLVLGALIPLVLPILPKKNMPNVERISHELTSFVARPVTTVLTSIEQPIEAVQYGLGLDDILIGIYLAVTVISIGLYIIRLQNLLKLSKKYSDDRFDKHVFLTDLPWAFSFFKKIYLPKGYDHKSREAILKHEILHVKEWHSVDRLVLDVLRTVFWWNPVLYFMKKQLIQVHEFLADRSALSVVNIETYLSLLFHQSRTERSSPPVNFFNNSLTKTRIIMMTKKRTNPWKRSLFILSIPLILIIPTHMSNSTVFTSTTEVKLESRKSIPPIVIPQRSTENGVPGIFPVGGERKELKVTSPFGMRNDPFDGERKQHMGIDIRAKKGTPVIATADGLVQEVKYQKNGYGNYVLIKHDENFFTKYAQMEKSTVQIDQMVKRGDVIGYVGSSGRSTAPHLHYEVMKGSRKLNPQQFIKDYEFRTNN